MVKSKKYKTQRKRRLRYKRTRKIKGGEPPKPDYTPGAANEEEDAQSIIYTGPEGDEPEDEEPEQQYREDTNQEKKARNVEEKNVTKYNKEFQNKYKYFYDQYVTYKPFYDKFHKVRNTTDPTKEIVQVKYCSEPSSSCSNSMLKTCMKFLTVYDKNKIQPPRKNINKKYEEEIGNLLDENLYKDTTDKKKFMENHNFNDNSCWKKCASKAESNHLLQLLENLVINSDVPSRDIETQIRQYKGPGSMNNYLKTILHKYNVDPAEINKFSLGMDPDEQKKILDSCLKDCYEHLYDEENVIEKFLKIDREKKEVREGERARKREEKENWEKINIGDLYEPVELEKPTEEREVNFKMGGKKKTRRRRRQYHKKYTNHRR